MVIICVFIESSVEIFLCGAFLFWTTCLSISQNNTEQQDGLDVGQIVRSNHSFCYYKILFCYNRLYLYMRGLVVVLSLRIPLNDPIIISLVDKIVLQSFLSKDVEIFCNNL
ncbi:hypothetical protein GFC28_2924 [Anoxybacillus sp. B2M1]|jgi:hypothetical protein|nr:hypothetical protein GFC28_2924 [Anoxybacillus sp. B2M1]